MSCGILLSFFGLVSGATLALAACSGSSTEPTPTTTTSFPTATATPPSSATATPQTPLGGGSTPTAVPTVTAPTPSTGGTTPTPVPTATTRSTPTPESSPIPATTGQAVFAIRDAAADMGTVTNVHLTIDSVRVHGDGEVWTTVSTGAQTFDLLRLRDKNQARLIAQTSLPAGSYSPIELTISRVMITDDNGQHDAKLPSGKLQVQASVNVLAGKTATADFDFMADQSLHETWNGTYIFAPVFNLKTRSNATVEIKPTREVIVTDGDVSSSLHLGINAAGDLDVGLRISPDAVLQLAPDGKILQSRGYAIAAGKIRTLDQQNGTITVVTAAGEELVLHLASDSKLQVNGSDALLPDIATWVGADVTAQYNVETKAISRLAAGTNPASREDAGARIDIGGTMESVDQAKGTFTFIADSGAPVTLKVDADTRLMLNGTAATIADLEATDGSRIDVHLDANAGTTGTVQARPALTVTATGRLIGVDSAKGTISILNQTGQPVSLFIGSQSRVMVNGSLAVLPQLKTLIGSETTVQYALQSRVASRVNARGQPAQSATVSGVLKAANPSQGTVMVVTDAGKEVTLNVTAASSVVADGTIASLASLKAKEGSSVAVEYNGQTSTVTSLHTGAVADAQASGTLKAVDVVNGALTIAADGRGDMVLKITPDTRLSAGGSVATLADLQSQVGLMIDADYDGKAQTATSANVHDKSTITIAGSLKAVDLLASTVTVAASNGTDVLVNMAADSVLRIGFAPSSLADLAAKVGSDVTVQYDSQTKALVRFQGGVLGGTPPPGQGPDPASGAISVTGTIKLIDPITGTITIASVAGQDVVVKVGSDAKVTVNGTTSTMTALAIGSRVTVEYNVDSMAAMSISVVG